ncbi:MAG TPA: cold shock domain-containing protein [Parafilimonas sp.]|jgi:cold shock CspA family protein|nr:cold shock domain-containing protein [Parafilimonas sp.]
MAKSKETFGKKEKEKKRLKQRQDKLEKMEERKANAKKGKTLDEMMAYIDENGNLSSTPPDPKKKIVFKQEDMNTGVPKHEEEEIVREGIISFFNDAKGYGFIKDLKSHESIFVHANQLSEPVKENMKVNFEVERTAKGLSALNVKKSI